MDTAEIKNMTVDEFRQLDIDENDLSVYELINGELVKRSAPLPNHQITLNLLNVQLSNFVLSKDLGTVMTAPIDVYLNRINAVQPDIVFISKTNGDIIDPAQGIVGVPNLVVEVVSPTSVVRDRVTKKEVYESVGVQEYWIVDPNNVTMEIYTLVENHYVLHSSASVEGVVQSRIIEDFSIDILTVFRKA